MYSKLFILHIIVAVKIIQIQTLKHPEYDQYCNIFNKDCRKDTEQYLKREQIYLNYLKFLKISKCSECGINKFSDLTNVEFQKSLTLKQYPKNYITAGSNSNLRKKLNFPEQLNWKKNGVVTSVKNQGSCGTSWSFSTTAMIQSSLILKGQAQQDIDLSEQYLLQCTPHGTCQQGYIYYATQTAVQKGLPYQYQLPYQERITGQQGVCKRQNNVKSSPNFQFFTNLSDEEIKSLLSQGPLSISVSATSWKNYMGGVHQCINEFEPKNHAVLLVGYDDKSWIIKNQWGQQWGQNGYIRVSLKRQNNCRIGEQIMKLSQNYLRFIIMISLLVIVI